MTNTRRQFLCDALTLAGVTAGAVTVLGGCGSSAGGIVRRVVSFAWTVSGLNGSSAHAYCRVAEKITLQTVNIDVTCMASTAPTTASFEQVLCRAWVSRQAVPTFNNGQANGASAAQASPDFGPVAIYNPNNLVVTYDVAPLQDIFYSAILKTWVSTDRTDSATSRGVFAQPSLDLSTGDYLVFGIDHSGVPGDLEMEVVLGYS